MDDVVFLRPDHAVDNGAGAGVEDGGDGAGKVARCRPAFDEGDCLGVKTVAVDDARRGAAIPGQV